MFTVMRMRTLNPKKTSTANSKETYLVSVVLFSEKGV